jgi:L-ascorbate metabolism protein UlaG (beta-lactamase superfamily)
MKITKYEHSCLVIEDHGKQLVIDPGAFTTSLPKLENVCSIIVTHVHQDHFSLELIDKILKDNPEVLIYTVEEVAKELGNRKHEVVQSNTSELCGIFHVSFYGGLHAIIHKSLPTWQNVGILVNDVFYYPGDSLTIPENVTIKCLAVPANAPWMKISETMDFLTAIKAKCVIPVHNDILSDSGHTIYNGRLEATTKESGGVFTFLKPGESIEI